MESGDRLRIAVTGSAGFLGGAWCRSAASRGWEVTRLVRGIPRSAEDIQWNPAGHWDPSALEGTAAVVHLAGASIAEGRWTKRRRRAIFESRVLGTRNLVDALSTLRAPPAVFVSASGIGFYGNTTRHGIDESSGKGEVFLAEVAAAWEHEARRAASIGARCVQLRLGAVLARDGGVLKAMALPFWLGLGGPLGTGEQGFNWIHRDDAIAAVDWAIKNDGIRGPLNTVAPQLVTQREFAIALGSAMHRPAFVPLPSLAVRMLLGDMGRELLLAGQFAVPSALERSGFRFLHPSLGQALRSEFARRRAS